MSSSYVVTKTPWRDGTTHQVMSPPEFMQRLAALVPRPRLHLIRFHGVLAPNAKLRAKVVPRPCEEPAQGAPSPGVSCALASDRLFDLVQLSDSSHRINSQRRVTGFDQLIERASCVSPTGHFHDVDRAAPESRSLPINCARRHLVSHKCSNFASDHARRAPPRSPFKGLNLMKRTPATQAIG